MPPFIEDLGPGSMALDDEQMFLSGGEACQPTILTETDCFLEEIPAANMYASESSCPDLPTFDIAVDFPDVTTYPEVRYLRP